MPYFGSDGNNDAAGINPPAVPESSFGELSTINQDRMYLCGGVATEDGTPANVTVYLDSFNGSNPSDHYFAVYKGGTTTDPTGATLIGVTSNITANYGDNSLAWETFALSSAAAFSNGDCLWLAVLGRGTNAQFGLRPRLVAPDGSGLTYREQWTNKSGAGSFDYMWQYDSVTGTTTPPSTIRSGGTTASSMGFAGYIEYTVGGSAPESIVLTPRRQFFFNRQIVQH